MATVVHDTPWECRKLLRSYFGCDRDDLLEVVKAMVAARSGCTANNSKSAPGYYAWDGGIARMREVFLPKGWIADEENGVELIINKDLGKRMSVMNADSRVCDRNRSPRNRTVKGPMAERTTDLNNQYDLFRDHQLRMAKAAQNGLPLWYLCVFDDGKDVRAEISCPIEYSGGRFIKYSERIFVVDFGEWEKLIVTAPSDDGGQEFQINVERRK